MSVVIMEQILLGVPAEMAVWLKEKKPGSHCILDLLGRLGDDYALASGRVQVNTKGDKRCYNCRRWGHLSYSCPNKRALFAGACQNIAWNENSNTNT